MDEPDIYCLPLEPEKSEAIKNQYSLEILKELKNQARHSYVADICRQMDRSKKNVRRYLERFEEADLLNIDHQAELQTYELHPEAVAIAEHYEARGMDVFKELWDPQKTILHELEDKGGCMHSKELKEEVGEDFHPTHLTNLKQSGDLKAHELTRGKFFYTPGNEPSESEVLEALKAEF